MNNEQLQLEKKNLIEIIAFMPREQRAYLAECFRSRTYEGDHAPALKQLKQIVADMPVTYTQDGLGDQAIASLHYFAPSADWYVTEKDVDGGIDQAFGLASINGEGPELGYISIRELCSIRSVELDFHFTPRTLAEVKAAKGW